MTYEGSEGMRVFGIYVLIAVVSAVVMASCMPAPVVAQPAAKPKAANVTGDAKVGLHKLPNGTPCAVLISKAGDNAITCGWGYKEK